MGWNDVERLGTFIERCEERNVKTEYTVDDVRGISNEKEFMRTKADLEGRSLASFQVVQPQEFAFNRRTTRMGEKIAVGFNESERAIIVTEDYVVFRVRETERLLPTFLFLYLNRAEFDRYARWDSWGSATEFFNWENMCAVPIRLPSIERQRKAVDIYRGLKDNLATQEVGLADLKLTCDGFLDRIKHTAPKKKVRELLEEVDERNDDESLTDVQGINIAKQFMPTIARIDESSLHNYKIVRPGEFAFSGMQTGRDQCIRIARQTEEEPIIVSSAYTVLRVRNKDFVAAYLMMWFSRAEIDRYGWFASDGSIRSNLDLERFFDMEVPVPSREIQQSVVHVFHCYIERQRIADALRQQLKDICPILVRGALKF